MHNITGSMWCMFLSVSEMVTVPDRPAMSTARKAWHACKVVKALCMLCCLFPLGTTAALGRLFKLYGSCAYFVFKASD